MQASPDDPKSFPFVLLGNKVDINGGSSREVNIKASHSLSWSLLLPCILLIPSSNFHLHSQVSDKNAIEWCASKGDIPYFETSAKEDYNIDAAFLCIAKMSLENENEQVM